MTIEQNYDIAFVAELALREKQIQQNYRPIIAVHKWFARRPGTLFRALTLSEFSGQPVAETFFIANVFPGKKVADPFMGGVHRSSKPTVSDAMCKAMTSIRWLLG